MTCKQDEIICFGAFSSSSAKPLRWGRMRPSQSAMDGPCNCCYRCNGRELPRSIQLRVREDGAVWGAVRGMQQ
jgi:hypothetical protein